MPITRSKTQYSKKGFVAIDIDGTTLVQKFDKNTLYGLTHSRSDLRKSLIEYCRMAKEEGYDIHILTARPELVEQLLLTPYKNTIGTKPTADIIQELKHQDIHIKSVVRVSPKLFKEGLKGPAMAELLKKYQTHGAKNAIGILFDDQLKQIKSVKALNNRQLFAYDINSNKDRNRFIKRMNYVGQETTLEGNSPVLANLRMMQEQIRQINKGLYPQEAQIFNKIVADLMVRLEEAERCSYEPEIYWVSNAALNLNLLIEKLITNPHTISKEYLSTICKSIFKTSLDKVNPGTKCERTIHNVLIYMTRLQCLQDLKTRCLSYHAHLEKELQYPNESFFSPTASTERAAEKKLIVDKLLRILEQQNPTKALIEFDNCFKHHLPTLKLFRTANSFIKSIQTILEKIPLIGRLFQSEGGKLAHAIDLNDQQQMFKNKHHYQKALRDMPPPTNSTP